MLIHCLLSLMFLAEPSAEQLMIAAGRGHLDQVKKLLDQGIDVNAQYRYEKTALFFAAEGGHAEVVSFLLEKGADPNRVETFYRSTPLSNALLNDHLETAMLFVKHGAEDISTLMEKTLL